MGKRPYALKRRREIAFTDEDGQTHSIGISWAKHHHPDFSLEGHSEIQRIKSLRNSPITISKMIPPANPSTYNKIPATGDQMTNATISSIPGVQLNTNEESQFFLDIFSFLETSTVSSSDEDGQSSGNIGQPSSSSNFLDGFDPSLF